MIKCSCGDKDCKTRIKFDENRLWFEDEEGKETLMYLDANTIVDLIRKLKEILIKMGDVNV